jgi:glycosyltransferase involved in cell wall biosynthesis
MDAPRYSFVLPVYEEEDTLPELYRRLAAVADGLDGSVEMLFVDDGSRDASAAVLLDMHERDPRVKVIRLSRNFGHQIALSAGLDAAAGDAVIIMDADLQDPPELVPELVAKWKEGFEIVYAVRRDRTVEPLWRRSTISFAYRLLTRMSDIELPVDAGDFRLVDRRALDAFKALRESNRYVRGMFSWVGFRQVGVPYSREARYGGKTKYPLRKLIRLGSDGLLSFSDAPLRLSLILGFVVSVAALLLGVTSIILRIAGIGYVPGWSSIVAVVSFLGGVQLIVIGMLGLYVGRIYDEVKRRPLYLVREAYGLTGDQSAPKVALSEEPLRP